MKIVSYKVEGKEFLFQVAEGVFSPTKTSNFIIANVIKLGSSPTRTLDLGCGCGYVGIILERLGLVSERLCVSDRSPAAVRCSEENAALNGVDLDARIGSLFDSWSGEQFGLIVDDVSGVAEAIGSHSSWFPDSSHVGAGVDGADLTCQFLANAPIHLLPNGIVVFPVLSLSNSNRIIETAKKYFGDVQHLGDQFYPVSAEVGVDIAILNDLMLEGLVNLKKIGDKWVWWTSIYSARNPL